MCDVDKQKPTARTANQSTSSAELSPMNVTEFRSVMTAMMTDFKTDILSQVNDSIAQVYQDFEQASDATLADDTSIPVDPKLCNNGDSLVHKIESFTRPTQPEPTNTLIAGNEAFKSLAEQFSTTEKTGPSIDTGLATIVNDLLKDKLSKEKLELAHDKYLKPQNCENLVAPKINKQVWQQLKQGSKNTDSTFQKIQNLWLSSLYAILQVCDNLSTNRASEENLTILTHAVVLSLSANREFNLKRRDLLRPDLNRQYAALCNPSTPVSTYLFGDDLNKEVEDLTKANKLAKKVTPTQRAEPYRVPLGRTTRGFGRGGPTYSGGRGSRYSGSHFLGSGRGQPRAYQKRQRQPAKSQ